MAGKKENSDLFGLRMQMSTKLVIIILAMAGIGGGSGLLGQLAFGGNVDNATDNQNAFDARFQRIETEQKEQKDEIKKMRRDVSSILLVQRTSVARSEARRATAGIKNRFSREAAYDHLLAKNLKRLENGKEPCVDLDCAER